MIEVIIMYKRIVREIEEIKAGTSPIEPIDLENMIANMLSDDYLTTGQYLELVGKIRELAVN